MTHKRKGNCKNSNSGVGTKPEEDFSALRRSLFAQLSPTTPLQRIAVGTVASWSWRCKLAADLDATSAARPPGEETPKADGETNSETNSKISQWYAADRESLRARITFLCRLKADFENCGRIRDDWKDDLTRCFGEDFFTDLKKWEPPNWDAALLAAHLVKHAETFGGPLPNTPEEEPIMISSPFQQKQMVSKLLSQETRHLRALMLMTDQKAGAARGGLNGSALGFESHDLESAIHNQQRAVQWFMRLRRHHL
jgi:hypothetical protein